MEIRYLGKNWGICEENFEFCADLENAEKWIL